MGSRKFAVLLPLVAAIGLIIQITETQAETLEELATEFWAWRAITQPTGGDDIPRIERPGALGA